MANRNTTKRVRQLPLTPVVGNNRPPYLKIKKSIRIAVSGDVHVTSLEQAIIDTPEFQRLRRIKQLGTAYLVYPTAVHTRFDHSLGVLKMTQRMIDAIRSNSHNAKSDEREISSEQEAIARLYALLHDVTHVPFGHSLEDELKLFKRHDINTARIKYFIGENSTIGKLVSDQLGLDLYKRFRAVYEWKSKPKDSVTGRRVPASPLPEHDEFIYDLVSDTVCADLLDYLERDGYFCNLKIAPEYRFLKFLYLHEDGVGCRRPFIRLWKTGKSSPRRDLLTDLARLLDARYLLAERVYFHHAKIASTAMLGRALTEAKELGEITEEKLRCLGDADLLRILGESDSPVARKLAKGLEDRVMLKTSDSCTYGPEDFEAIQHRDHGAGYEDAVAVKLADGPAKKTIENRLADLVNRDHGEILLYALSSEDTNAKAADIHVLWRGKPEKLRNIGNNSTTKRLKQTIESHKELWGLHVVMPERFRDSASAVRRLKECCDAEFFTRGKDKAAAMESVIEEALEVRLRTENQAFSVGVGELNAIVSEQAKELAGKLRDDTPLKTQLDAAVQSIIDAANSEEPTKE